MVPMLMCGLVRSNLALATCVLPCLMPSGVARIGYYGLFSSFIVIRGYSPRAFAMISVATACGDLRVGVELHAVTRPTLSATAKIAHVAEHLRQRNECRDDASARTLLHRLH